MRKLKRRTQELIIAGAIILVALGVVLGVHIYTTRNRTIPPAIARQISFRVYWPKSTNAVPDKQSIKYDAQQGVFSYVVLINANSVTVTEQATPSEFTDIPNYFSALINHLNNYDTFSSANGTVYLTKPSGTGGEAAVINQSGTLLFAHTQGTINENNWRLFFNNLQIIEN